MSKLHRHDLLHILHSGNGPGLRRAFGLRDVHNNMMSMAISTHISRKPKGKTLHNSSQPFVILYIRSSIAKEGVAIYAVNGRL
jgi:hypothetical protein